ncbi:MAG: bifunctional hydroxymethylpyrimidine kinase/phosphomethylpyrimidine kinase [Candidatus Schekmanbacteria bacterium]|nr:bifunctional hydroxymethylpyrimidine kinase/phosphomethylpyrimidine kinase [Candidatus Schekmanbacteria bacterium]
MPNPPLALTIAGFDPCGGAGLQADLKTFQAHGVYGLSAATTVTVQNTLGVAEIFPLPAPIIRRQIDNLLEDFTIQAVKIGMVGSSENIPVISRLIKEHQIKQVVLDPIIKSQSGFIFLDDEGQNALLDELLPLCLLITPNLKEAEQLCSFPIKNQPDMLKAAKYLHNRGAKNILIKTGMLNKNQCSDLFSAGANEVFRHWNQLDGQSPHGTGCILAAAITANLALGQSLADSIGNAQIYLQKLLKSPLKIGHGYPLINLTHYSKKCII